MVPTAIRERVQKMVETCLAKAEAHFKRKYRMPVIKYNLTGRVGGTATGDHTLCVHPVFLMENLEHYIANTIPHEVAHLIDSAHGDNARPMGFSYTRGGRVRRAKRSVHGPSWRNVMRVLGVQDADRCHTYSMENVKTKGNRNRVEYQCGGCKQQFWQTPAMHQKLQAGRERWCRKCGRGTGQLLWVKAGVVQPSAVRVPSQTFVPPRFRTQRPTSNYAGFLSALTAALQTPAGRQTLIPETPPFQNLKPAPAVPGRSNMEIAKAIMVQYGYHLTRGQFITRAVEQGMKSTTASTYYNQLKRSA